MAKKNGELVLSGGKWLSPRPGYYVHRFTCELLRKEDQVTPRQIAEMQFGAVFTKASAKAKLIYEGWVRWIAWKDYQTLQDEGIRCYPAYDLHNRGKILFYKRWDNDKIDAKFWPIYRDRCRRAMERTARRYRTLMAAR